MKRFLLVTIAAFVCQFSYAATPLPQDVKDFRALADECEHFASEQNGEPDAQQQKELDVKLTATCGKAVMMLKTLREKYKNDEALMKVINSYDF